MGEKSKLDLEEELSEKPTPKKPSVAQIVCDSVWLTVTTVVLIGVYVVSYLANDTNYGFRNSTGEISDKYYTQITPASFAFVIWTIIYIWQALWIIYAWSFLCRPWMPRTIFTGVYIGYTIINILDISWLYIWGNLYIDAASAVLFLFQVFYYPTLAMLVGYLYKVRSQAHKIDVLLTWILPVNGMFIYATWTTIASLINLAVVVQYSHNVSGTTSGTISLSLLLAALVVYFILENTVFYRFLQYVFTVYPVVIWALSAVLATHWGEEGEERNNQFALGLLIISIILFIIRLIIVLIFSIIRPLSKYRKSQYV